MCVLQIHLSNNSSPHHRLFCRSWLVLFILRQVIVLSCVKTGEVIAIDILALRTPLFFKTFGWFTTLMIVQSRGWPFVLTLWSISDFCFLYGSHGVSKIKEICLYYQRLLHAISHFRTLQKSLLNTGFSGNHQ